MSTKMVLETSKVLGKYGIIIFLILVTAIILLGKYLKSEEGQYKLSSINLKIPVILNNSIYLFINLKYF